MRWSDPIAWLARAVGGLFGGGRKGKRSDKPTVAEVAPWPSYCEVPSGVRGVSFAYSWIHVADVEGRVRECVRRGINLIGIELTACAETPDALQVMDRWYWINRIGECLTRADVWLAACRKYRCWLKITWGNDCDFPSPSLEQTRQIAQWGVARGPDGLLLQPVVEAENRKKLDWSAHYNVVMASGFPSSHCVDNRCGGMPISVFSDWVSDFHPGNLDLRPVVVPSLVENDAPINDDLMLNGRVFYTPPNPAWGDGPIQDYYREARVNCDLLRRLFIDCIERGHGVIYWMPHFFDSPDWAGIETVGAL